MADEANSVKEVDVLVVVSIAAKLEELIPLFG